MTSPDRAVATVIAVAVFGAPVVGRGYAVVSKRIHDHYLRGAGQADAAHRH